MAEVIAERVDVWAASVQDTPGALAKMLTGLSKAGADLDFIVARRSPEQPGTGVVFVTPLRGDHEIAAASDLGFTLTGSLHSVRVEGINRAGIGAELTEKIAAAGINLRGLSAAVIGTKFILYLALDTARDAEKAIALMKQD